MPSELVTRRVLHLTDDQWIVFFPWPKNPLPLNGSHGGWRKHSREAKRIRALAVEMLTYARIPHLGRCRAQLTWWVSTTRTRDVDNLADLEKRLFDALVDVGAVDDDRPELMEKPRPEIRNVSDSAGLVTEAGFTLTVTRLEA